MIKYNRQKIFLVTDGHPVHKTNKLNEWLKENKKRIKVFFLPPYSPELNPQEYVNQDEKQILMAKKDQSIDEMKNNVDEFMNYGKNDKRHVQKYFHAKHVRYAA
jgi:uncharacterized protein YegL